MPSWKQLVSINQKHLLLTADLSTHYNFPLHIIVTDLQPDLVWWDEALKKVSLVELTVCFDTNFLQAAQRKEGKYIHLVEQGKAKGYKVDLMTLQVGSLGFIDIPSFESLSKKLSLSRKALDTLLITLSKVALAGSYNIWCTRNRAP